MEPRLACDAAASPVEDLYAPILYIWIAPVLNYTPFLLIWLESNEILLNLWFFHIGQYGTISS